MNEIETENEHRSRSFARKVNHIETKNAEVAFLHENWTKLKPKIGAEIASFFIFARKVNQIETENWAENRMFEPELH